MKKEGKKMKEDLINKAEAGNGQIKIEKHRIVNIKEEKKTTTTTKIKVLNWNARGIRNKKEELSTRLQEYDIVILTETKMNNKESLKFKGYNVVEKNSPTTTKNSAGGIAIIVRNDLKTNKLKEIDFKTGSIEILGLKIGGLDTEIYRRPGIVESRNTWRNIIQYFKKLKNVIVVGDFMHITLTGIV